MTVKMLDGNYIISIGELQGAITSDSVIEITEAERNHLVELFSRKPTAPNGWEYQLKNDDLTWELDKISLDPDPDLDDAEAYRIIFGGGAE